MNTFTREKKQTKLEKEIAALLDRMASTDATSEEYSTMASNLKRLYEAKQYEKDRRVSADTIAVVAGNLLGIALILGYEKINVITSKALSFVIKGRV
jgi:hypothetical protein